MAPLRPATFAAAVLLLAFASPGSLSRADDARDVAIYAKLAEPTMIEVRDVALHDVVEYLNDFHDLSIEIDEAALKAAGLSSDMPLTYTSPRVGNTSRFALHGALWEMLAGTNLSYRIKNHALVITTSAAAQDWQREYVKFVSAKKR